MAEIKFIGTGSGKASLKRFHSSFLLSSESYNLLIDAGDGITRALMRQDVTFNSIDGILFSHLHPDHYTGFPLLVVQMKMNSRENSLDIFCHESYSEFLKEFLYRSYIFEEKLGFEITYKPFDTNETFEVADGINITARQNRHLQTSAKFDFRSELNFSSSSFLLKAGGKNIFYTGDIGNNLDLYLFEDHKTDIMISEITHIAPEEILEAFSRLKPDKLYITHLSDDDEKKVAKLNYLLSAKERKKVVQAFDGLVVKV